MNSTHTIVKMVFDRWNASIKNYDNILNAITDDQMQKEIAPGRNRGIYLLGHLIAVHDEMLILLNMGDKLYPALHEPFIKSRDKEIAQIPSVKELRDYWNKQCQVLREKFESLMPEEWFERHTAVSEEDFIKEPHRNKLNIILTRTTHLNYHTGQIVLLKGN
jgi:hypothetical protein